MPCLEAIVLRQGEENIPLHRAQLSLCGAGGQLGPQGAGDALSKKLAACALICKRPGNRLQTALLRIHAHKLHRAGGALYRKLLRLALGPLDIPGHSRGLDLAA